MVVKSKYPSLANVSGSAEMPEESSIIRGSEERLF